jgi:hypothetical protein
MGLESDSVLVVLIDNYVGAVLLDEDENETCVVRAVEHDERKETKYYEVTCVRAEQGVSGSWAVPPSSFVTSSDVAEDILMLGYALMDMAAPGGPVLLYGVGDMVSAHSAREAAL